MGYFFIYFFNIVVLFFSIIVSLLFLFYAFVLGLLIDRIYVFWNLRQIKKHLIENDLLDKIGEIDYWNESNFFLTKNYFIIKKGKQVRAILYKEILSIKSNVNYEGIYLTYGGKVGHSRKGLQISGKDFKYIVIDSDLYYDNLNNICDYLLNKNKKIIVEKEK